MALFQIQKQGTAGVVRRLLGVIGSTFSGAADVVQPVTEIRALRAFEDFDEGLYLLYGARFEAAVAGEFSYVGLLPHPDFLIHVEEVVNLSAQTIDTRIGFTMNPVITLTPCIVRDGRLGLGANTPLNLNSGAEVAPDGVVGQRIQVAANIPRRLDHIIQPGGQSLAFVGGTVNTAVSIDLLLRLIPITRR